VAFSDQGMGHQRAAHRGGVSKYTSGAFYRRRQLHGGLFHVEKPTKQPFLFEVKKNVIERHIASEVKMKSCP